MTAETEMKILNLYRGQPIKKAVYALDIMKTFTEQKKAELRVKLCGLQIGD